MWGVLARSGGDASLRRSLAPPRRAAVARPPRCIVIQAQQGTAGSAEQASELLKTLPPELQELVAEVVQLEQAGLREMNESLAKTNAALCNENMVVHKENKVLSQKNNKLVVELVRKEKFAEAAMFAAGVLETRQVFEWVEQDNDIDSRSGGRAKGWQRLLQEEVELRACLVQAVPWWLPPGLSADDEDVPRILGVKIAEVYRRLNGYIHSFSPTVGLVIRPGVPDVATTKALRCIADAFGVRWEEHEMEALVTKEEADGGT